MAWETMSDLEKAQCIYWDMYKDAYGYRPRGIDTSSWTLQDFEQEFEVLARVIEAEELARKESERAASIAFEQRVATLIASGAKTRETALRWIHDAEGSDGDDEYLCFLVGLPYGYFRKSA